MSSSPPAPERTPLGPDAGPEADPNAAMLSELDALLERMMALPVSPTDEVDPLPIRRTEQPPSDVPIITVTEAAAQTGEAPATLPVVSTSEDDLYFHALLAEQQSESTRSPEPVVLHRPPPAPVEEPTPEAPAPRAPVIREDEEPRYWSGGLTWTNRAFDQAASCLGKPGRWLRGEAGRTLLGWSGLLLFAIVAGLAVFDYLTWTR